MNPGIPSGPAGFSAEGKTGMGQRFFFKFRVHITPKPQIKKPENKNPCSLVFQSNNNKTPVPCCTDIQKKALFTWGLSQTQTGFETGPGFQHLRSNEPEFFILLNLYHLPVLHNQGYRPEFEGRKNIRQLPIGLFIKQF
jgi:hypothetical protein